MNNTRIIAVKEIKTYFSSPMAYVVATAFVAVTGFFFVASVSNAFAEATIRGFLAGAVFFLILMAPAITMRLLAEEQKLGTLELLLTSPVKEFEVVFGKFLAALFMVFIMLLLSLYFVLILFIYGDPDIGPIISGYLGLLLYASATLSIGLFASSLSANQIVGLMVGAGILTALSVIDFVSGRFTGNIATILDNLQLGASFSVFDSDSFGVAESGHFADFARGIISIYDIFYYISITVLFIILTVLILESRRWR